jgi:hypothetical protein
MELTLPSPQQKELFARMAAFVETNIMGWVHVVYDTYGREGVQSEDFVLHVLPHAEVYYDSCAAALYSRADSYLNHIFDAMMAVDLGVNTHPMDHLHFIVLIAARVMMDLRIPDLAIFKTLPRPAVTGASAFHAKRPQDANRGDDHATGGMATGSTNGAAGSIRETIMVEVKAHIHELIQANRSLARDLRGCDHEHEPVSAGDKIFTFQVVPENMINTIEAAHANTAEAHEFSDDSM